MMKSSIAAIALATVSAHKSSSVVQNKLSTFVNQIESPHDLDFITLQLNSIDHDIKSSELPQALVE